MLTTHAHLATQPESSALPEQPAVFKRGIRGNYWIVERCIFCGKRHVHGAGEHHQDPARFLSPRLAHCITDGRRGSYHLVLEEGQGDDWQGAVKELQHFVVEGTR